MFMDKEMEEKENSEKPCVDAENEASAVAVEPDAEAGGDASQENDGEIDNDNNSTTPDLAKLIEEAENRGYLRGRNAKIEELMAEPGMYCPLGVEERAGAGLPQAEILSNMRRSVWDC